MIAFGDPHRGRCCERGPLVPGSGLASDCRVHFIRNLLAVVPKTHQHMPATLFRTVFAQPDVDAATVAWDQVVDQLAAGFPKAVPLIYAAKTDVRAFSGFPKAHRQKI